MRLSISRQRWDICTYNCLERATQFALPQEAFPPKTPSANAMHFCKTTEPFVSRPWTPFRRQSPRSSCARSSYRTRSYMLLPSSIIFPSLTGEQSPSTGQGERTICNLRQRAILLRHLLLLPSICRDVPDEAGPGVAAGVAKVDDQGKVAVVDGDLGEANDASDALLFGVVSYAGPDRRWAMFALGSRKS
jgi:hypothetical protein